MQFTCQILQGKRAVEIPGSRGELRLKLEISESELPNFLPLVLRRGQMLFLTLSTQKEENGPPPVTLKTWVSVAPVRGAIRVDGHGGGSVTLDLPGDVPSALQQLLRMRERILIARFHEDAKREGDEPPLSDD